MNRIYSILFFSLAMMFFSHSNAMEANLLPLQTPDEEGKVVATFPSREFLEKTKIRGIQVIGLGQHETFLSNIETRKLNPVPMSVAADAPMLPFSQNTEEYGQPFSFEKDGFEAT